MSGINLGIIGGGQLGSMLSEAAKKLNIKSIIYCDDVDAPAQNFCEKFIHGDYNDKNKIQEFVNKVQNEAKIAANLGPTFGKNGHSFLRFNFATTTENVRIATERLSTAFSDLQ